MEQTQGTLEVSLLVRIAVSCAVVSLYCLRVFLWRGFTVWSIGIGIVFGVPLAAIAMVLYSIAGVRELWRYGEL